MLLLLNCSTDEQFLSQHDTDFGTLVDLFISYIVDTLISYVFIKLNISLGSFLVRTSCFTAPIFPRPAISIINLASGHAVEQTLVAF